ncbi:MAG TPA: hypothetical protein V6D06_04400, partial [Trichocoleus sp.]
GQIPNAATGFFDAISRESQAMPANSGLVVANTSETILTPGQRQAFAAGAAEGARGGRGGNTFNFSPTIDLGAGSTEQQAREILRYFEVFFEEHQQAQLT